MYILLVFQQLIASFTHIIGKSIAFDFPSSLVLFYRALTATSVFIIWFLFRRKRLKKIDKKDIITLIILGALNIPINQFLFLTSLHYTNPPNVALAYALTPAFVLIIALIFLKESANWKKITGICVAIIGTVLILFEKGFDFSSENFTGDILALTASFSWGLYTVVGKKFTMKYGAAYSTALATLTGFLLFAPIFYYIPNELTAFDFKPYNWLQIFYLGAVTSGLGYALWYYALKRIEASKVSVFNNIQPIFTTILSIIIFGQELSAIFISGGVLIIGGVILTQRG